VPSLDAADLQSVALSPDGSELAVAVQPSPTLLDLDVYSLTGGGVRTWSLRGTAAGQWSVDRPATNNAPEPHRDDDPPASAAPEENRP